jgi:hypothetical protein
VLALTVPAACAVAVRMWDAELLRIARGARFVAEIEDWVNSRAGTGALAAHAGARAGGVP